VWRHLPADPLWILWHSWDIRFSRFLVRDTVVNVALYAPLGMSGYLAFKKKPWLPLLLGFLLSVSMELVQLFVPGRNTSLVDVATNVLGTIAGLGLGFLFDQIAGPGYAGEITPFSSLPSADKSALILLFIWTGALLFPFFPQVGSSIPIQRIKLFFAAPLFALVPFVSAAASWLAAGFLMRAAGLRSPRLFLALSLLAIPVQFFIVNHQPVPSELSGAICGFLFFTGLGGLRKPALWVALAFLIAILIRGLSPFHFATQSQGFSWIPFAGFLATEWQYGLLVLLEKSFYYGTAIWLFNASGIRLTAAAAITAATLAFIEIAQIHLPGRTAEMTDPLMAILLAFAFGILSRQSPARKPRGLPRR